MQRGSVVAVLGLFLGNLGGITALVIGIIISYLSGTPESKGYHNFLLAITIAGCLTIGLSLFSALYIPNVQGKQRIDNFLVLPFKRFFNLLKDIQKYPMAFLYCISWVIWNVSFNNFMRIASGWIGGLVNAVIQDRTNDDRFPFLPNMFLVVVSLIVYYYVDLQKGKNDVNNGNS
ncbi:Vacuole effluxer Atg22 like family protein [Candida albicans]|uniref:Autophagy-related protein n=1 Tax=Candida albicans TaxID=5476 RepID=A0A8H6F2K6_CANAX|nr:Vacuole effluxer Atg22 like family protein [Candida albicans]